LKASAASLLLLLSVPVAAAPVVRLPTEADRQLLIDLESCRPIVVPPAHPPAILATQADIDVQAYDLTLFLDVASERVEGMNAISFVTASTSPAADELVLDLDSDFLTVTRVVRDGVDVPLAAITHASDLLRIPLVPALVQGAAASTVEVYYQGQPQEMGGGFGTLRFETHDNPPQPLIYTLSEPYLGRGWWPCKDTPGDKALVSVHVEAPDTLTVVGNGVEGPSAQGRPGHRITTWTSRYPISTYLVAVSATNFATWQDSYVSQDGLTTMPVSYWAYPELEAQAREDWSITPAAIDFYSRIFVEYPFLAEKYGEVSIPMWGAMEHQTATSYGAQLLAGDHRFDYIVVHELAHQWWGDLVGPQTFDSIWLNEGFATYCEALWFEEQGGMGTYLTYMRNLDRLPPTGTDFQGTVDSPGDSRMFSDTVYRKGGWTLHMLRWVLGQPAIAPDREVLMPVLRAHAAAHAYASAQTSDFVATASAVAGQDLSWFFDEWVSREGRPLYEVGWVAEPQPTTDYIVRVRVRQVQAGATYRMPVDVRLTFADQTTRDEIVWADQSQQDFAFSSAQAPVGVSWDPDGWVLKAVTPVDIDQDDDGFADWLDSCPTVPDPLQVDANGNGIGDACEPGLDFDGDGVVNELDCAPADPQAFTPPPDDALVFVHRRGADFVFTFALPPPAGQHAPAADITHGLLADLLASRSMAGATCAAPAVATPEWIDAAQPSAGGDWYVVHAWNGCAVVDVGGSPLSACR
jgi:aminopeptidase N